MGNVGADGSEHFAVFGISDWGGAVAAEEAGEGI